MWAGRSVVWGGSAIGIGVWLAVFASHPAQAQCSIHRVGVPDFDQRRQPLPSGGENYCAPTSAMDWMAYICDHGQPQVVDGPRDGEGQFQYDFITDEIEAMGQLMLTDAEEGTTVGFVPGILAYLQDTAPGLFNVTWQQALWFSYPEPESIYAAMVKDGLVCLAIGWYGWQGAWRRYGGHAVAAQYVYDACSSAPTLGYCDPDTGDEESNSEQSEFCTRETTMTEYTDDWFNEITQIPETRTRWRLDTYTGSRRGFLDGIYSINPAKAVLEDPISGEIEETQCDGLADDGSDPEGGMSPPDGNDVDDAEFHPGNYIFYVSTARAEEGHLYIYAPIEPDPVEVMALQRSGPMATNPDGELYLVNAGAVQRYLVSLDGGSTLLGTFAIGSVEFDDLVFDDAANELVGVIPSSMQVVRFQPDLSAVTVHTIPGDTQAGGELSIAPDAAGDLWICGTDNAYMDRLVEDGAGRLSVAESVRGPGVSITGLQINDLGHLIGVSDGEVFELRYDPGVGRWVPDPNSVFAGLETGGIFEVSRSRFNFRPEWSDIAAFRNVRPEPYDGEVRIWCRADLTTTNTPDDPGFAIPDGIVDTEDIEYFTDQYERGNVRLCDVSGPSRGVPDGVLDGTDRSYYRDLWDAGLEECPAMPSDVPLVGTPDADRGQNLVVGPNPFRLATTIRFELPRPEEVTVAVYDMNGRFVQRLTSERLDEGTHEVVWNGRDGSDRETPNGVYWIRLMTSDGTRSERVLRLR